MIDETGLSGLIKRSFSVTPGLDLISRSSVDRTSEDIANEGPMKNK
jgi:hypothetical protein